MDAHHPFDGIPVFVYKTRVLAKGGSERRFHSLTAGLEMGNVEVGMPSQAKSPDHPAISEDVSVAEPAPAAKPKKKICCACPETKRLRDECIVQNGEAACEKWIQAHLQCLRAEGFNV